MSTPTQPNVPTDLSGGTGITKADIVNRILRRVDDNPYTDVLGAALNDSDVTSQIQVSADATAKYQIGGQIDFVEDGTFESCQIISVDDTTHITVRRAIRLSPKTAHKFGATFRYMGRWMPFTISESVDDILRALWPELFDVVHVDWNISTTNTPELWYVLPNDANRVLEVYQRTLSTPTDLRVPQAWGGPHWLEPDFLDGGAPKGEGDRRAIQVYGTAINSPDNKLHAIYLRRLKLDNLTVEQQAILMYQVAGILMETAMAGESRPERRPALGAIASPDAVYNVLLQQAEILKRKEEERLMEFLPRRNRIKWRGGRHYSESFFTGWHPVRPY